MMTGFTVYLFLCSSLPRPVSTYSIRTSLHSDAAHCVIRQSPSPSTNDDAACPPPINDWSVDGGKICSSHWWNGRMLER